MDSVRRIDLDRLPEIRAALIEWVKKAREEFRLEAVYLYGSFARGNPHELSDIDLVLIGPFAGKLPERIEAVLWTTELPVEPLCFTPSEWSAMVAAKNPLALEVLRTGKAL
jgi:predicted nucleotidyltransferase